MNQFIQYSEDGESVIYYNPKTHRAETVARWLWDLFGQIATIKSFV